MSVAQPSTVLEQLNGGEFRVYRYTDENTGEVTDLLSVTSVRTLCGESYNLVNWKLANLADAALGTMKRTVIGPRGGVKDVRQVWEYPSEFARMYADCALDDDEDEDPEAEKARQVAIDKLRKWLRERADEPRNIAAIRGTIAHKAIENDVAWDRIERPYVEHTFASLSARDRAKVKRAVSDEDVHFVRNTVRHYWGMRTKVPMTILAREVRVVNLTVGYAGTFDALVWLHGDITPEGAFVHDPSVTAAAKALKPERVTVADIERIGGTIVLLDWKTSTGIHTDQVVQAHAYLAAEFAVTLRKDARITALLNRAMFGGLVHLRPNGYGLYLFPYEEEAVRAFYGSVAFARFLARHPEANDMFIASIKGVSAEEDE